MARRKSRKQKLKEKRIENLGGWGLDGRSIRLSSESPEVKAIKKMIKPNWPFPTNTPRHLLP